MVHVLTFDINKYLYRTLRVALEAAKTMTSHTARLLLTKVVNLADHRSKLMRKAPVIMSPAPRA